VQDPGNAMHDKVPLQGKPGLGYYVIMSFGTPQQHLNVLVDTGSSNLAVACSPDIFVNNYFDKSKSTSWLDTGRSVMVPYTQGQWEGELLTELVSIGGSYMDDIIETNEHFHNNAESSEVGLESNKLQVRANLACIESSTNFFINGSKWHGILGLGFAPIARPNADIAPFLDTLVKKGALGQDLFALKLCGTLDKRDVTDVSMGGSLDLGELDQTSFSGSIFYTPLHRRWYYDVLLTNVDIGGSSVGVAESCQEFNHDKTIVDSGTTNLRLPAPIFERLVDAIKNATTLTHPPVPDDVWRGRQVMCWKQGTTPWDRFPEIGLWLASDTSMWPKHSLPTHFRLVISPQQYLRAIKSNSFEDGHSKRAVPEDCYKFAVTPSNSGSVLGAVVMEGYYVVFDRAKDRIGFALSTCNLRDPARIRGPRIDGPFPFEQPPVVDSYGKDAVHMSTSSGIESSKYATSHIASSPLDLCAFNPPQSLTQAFVRIIVFGIAGISIVVIILLCIVVLYQHNQNRKSEARKKEKEESGYSGSVPAVQSDQDIASETNEETGIGSAGTLSAGTGVVGTGLAGSGSASVCQSTSMGVPNFNPSTIGLFGGSRWRQAQSLDEDQRALVHNESQNVADL